MAWSRKKKIILCNLSADSERKKRSMAAARTSKSKGNKCITPTERSKTVREWQNSWFKKG